MKTFIKPVCSKQKSTAISKCRQAEMMLEHIHSDLQAAPRKQYVGLAVQMYQSHAPLAPTLRHGASGKNLDGRREAGEQCGLPGSRAGSPHTRPATSLTRPQCTGARRQVGQTPQ